MVAEALITWDFREEVVLRDYPSLKKYLLCWMQAEEKNLEFKPLHFSSLRLLAQTPPLLIPFNDTPLPTGDCPVTFLLRFVLSCIQLRTKSCINAVLHRHLRQSLY